MNNMLKRTISGVIALGIAVTSVQVSAPHVHSGHAEETENLVATGIKGDANADGVVTEADLDVYESFLLGRTEIADNILQDMDIDYGNTYQYVEVNGNDYAAVRNYLEGCTQTIEPSGHIDYKNDGGIHSVSLYAGYYSSNAVYIAETDSLTNSATEHEITEIIWGGEKPDWATEIEREDGYYIDCTPDEADVGTYNMIIVGKDMIGKYHAIANCIEVLLPDYKATTEDGNIFYEDGACVLFGPGTYNVTSSVTDVSDMIMIIDNGQPGKCIINLNGMNVNYGDALYPGDFIQTISLETVVPVMDIDIVLSGSNVIRNADVNLYTEGQVNIYGDDDDTLSLLGNSGIRAGAVKVNGGKVTVKSSYYQAMEAEQLTMLGGSLDLSFSPVAGQQWNTSNTTLTGVGLLCDEVIIRRGDLLLSGNDGAVQGVNSTPKFYVSPLYCDIEVDVSDDGTTYTAIEGSPFSDPDNSPSAYTDAVGAGAPDNSVDISDYIADKNFIKIITGLTYSYKVTIDAGEHGNVTYDDDTSAEKTFWVSGGEKLPEGITLTADEGWAIDKITASVNGASPVNVLDISEIVISGDTVITITTKDTEAPVISGIRDNGVYCGTVEFTVTDDSDVTVTISDETAQPDSNGVYTIVGDISSYSIIATDEFGNETIYTIVVYDKHPSLSNYSDNEDGTHTGVCDYCGDDVVEEHNFGGWESVDEALHENVCVNCGYTDTDDHIMGDWQSDDGDTHSRECSICHYLENTGHSFDRWTDNQNTGMHERICVNCGYTDEADHDFGYWTPNYETGKHEKVCASCGHTEEADHNFDEWTKYDGDQHIRFCTDCVSYYETEDHNYGDWTANLETGWCKIECVNCGHTEEADHVYGDWTANLETGNHEKECANCGYTKSESHFMSEWMYKNEEEHYRECHICDFTEEADHDFGEWINDPESENHKRECEKCGHMEIGEHNFNDWTPHIASNTHRTNCNDCGLIIAEPHSSGECEEYNDLQHITNCEECAFYWLADHTYSEWTNNPVTGKCERECTACKRTEEAEHVFGEWTDNPDTDRHERECETCGYVEEAGHDFGDWTDNPDTDRHERECAVCDHTEAEDHNFSRWIPDIKDGDHKRDCEDCGFVDAAEHKMNEYSDYSSEKHIVKCEDCSYYKKKDHVFDEWTDNSETGKHEKNCEACGHVEEADHNMGEYSEYDESTHIRYCTDCGSYYETEAHIYGDWEEIVDTNNHKRECQICGDTEYDSHNYGEWTDNHDTGKHKRECNDCGRVQEADHVFGQWTDNHENGKCERECTVCGHVEEAEHVFGEWTDNHETNKCERECEVCGRIEQYNHSYGEYVDNHESGKHERTCTECGHTEESVHVFSDWESVGSYEEHKTSCTLCGHEDTAEHTFDKWTEDDDIQHKRECEDCGFSMTEEHKFGIAVNIGNEQHKFTCSVCGADITEDCHGVWETVKESTCTEEGTEEMVCEVCGEKHTRAIEKLPHDFVEGRCSSCYMEDPTIGESSTNPPTGVPFAPGLTALIPASMMVFFARPKSKKK